MEENVQPQMTAAERQLLVQQAKWVKQARNGASWFYWIAGMTVLNTILIAVDAGFRFFVGLGIAQLVDAFAYVYLENGAGTLSPAAVWGIALAINTVISTIFLGLGIFARKAKPWAFIVGIVLFSLDAFFFLLFEDLLGFGFHIFVAVMVGVGLSGLNKLRKSIPQQPAVEEPEVVVEQL